MTMNFEEHCNRMNQFITTGKDRQNLQHAERVLNYFIKSMKKSDPVFGKIANRAEMAGSFADDVKVSHLDEFDFLVYLKLPNFKQYTVAESSPAHVTINAKCLSQNVQNDQQSRVLTMLDENYFIKKSALHLWIQQMLDFEFNCLKKDKYSKKAQWQLSTEGYTYLIQRNRSGPAHTLSVKVVGYSTPDFSIDIVPAISLDGEAWVSKTRSFQHNTWVGKWNAVPKEYSKDNNSNDIEWICSYANIERFFLKDTNKMKNMIRIFKKLRDTNKLTTLKSYHIKTVFLWKTESITQSYWRNTDMEKMFFEMFNEILGHVKNKELPFFWDRRHNMFKDLTENQQQHLLGNLRKIQQKLLCAQRSKNWDVLPSILLNEKERVEYENQSGNSNRSTPSSSQSNSFEMVNPPLTPSCNKQPSSNKNTAPRPVVQDNSANADQNISSSQPTTILSTLASYIFGKKK